MNKLEAQEIVAVSGGVIGVVVDPGLTPTCPVAMPPSAS